MGANIATDIAADAYAETTVACINVTVAQQVAKLFDSPELATEVSEDVSTVEFCGALKNIVALGAGIITCFIQLQIHAFIAVHRLEARLIDILIFAFIISSMFSNCLLLSFRSVRWTWRHF